MTDDDSPESESPPFEPELTDELDLHTFAPRDVAEVVRAYLEACAGRFSEVRVVHGKGTSTQQRTVHAVLRGHPLVESFGLAPPERGGWGATIVRLKGR
jgi:dsDNA-specific endonuclease/ATPase MutS2